MRILIIGAGAVGFHLAQELTAEGHEVSVVERNPQHIARLRERLDALVVPGSGTSPAALKQARVRTADLVVAVTDQDEVNMIGCLLASKLKAPRCIARVRNPELTRPQSILPMSDVGVNEVINPDEIAVESLVNLAITPHATDIADFSDGAVLLRGFDVTEQSLIAGKQLADLKDLFAGRYLLVLVHRGHEDLWPSGQTVIAPKDRILVIMARDNLSDFVGFIEKNPKPVNKVVIMGASRIGVRLAERLHGEARIPQVLVIEPDPAAAAEAADRLSGRIRVLAGEPSDPEIAADVAYDDTDFFCALTDHDERNLLGALWAREQGVRRTCILTNNTEYVRLLESIDIDVILNPQLETVGALLHFIRRGQVRKVLKVKNTKSEVIEIAIEAGARIAGKKLADVHWPAQAVVGAQITDGRPVIPTGDSVLNPGDKVILFTASETAEEVLALFQKRTSLLRRT